MPRRRQLYTRIDVFLGELAASGMHLDRQRAGELITGQVCAKARRPAWRGVRCPVSAGQRTVSAKVSRRGRGSSSLRPLLSSRAAPDPGD